MMTPGYPQLALNQSGIATLITTTVLLFLTTLIVVYAANVSLIETKASANEYKSIQSFFAAQAGLELALATLAKTKIENIPQTKLAYFGESETLTLGWYAVSIDSTDINHLKLRSVGYSSDHSSQSIHHQGLLFSPALRTDYKKFLISPIVVTGDISITPSNIMLENTDKVLVWSGGSIHVNGQLSIENQKKLYANDIRTQNPHAKIFGLKEKNHSNKNLKQSAWLYDCKPICTELKQSSARVHYIDGGLRFKNTILGSITSPIILYIDLPTGTQLSLNNVTLNGLIFVQGDWDNNHEHTTINGAIIVNGNLKNTANLSVSFNKMVLDNMHNIGIYAPAPGSWNDIQTTF